MLGDGVAVEPEEGKVYAPADGTVLSVFDTKHAVCFASMKKRMFCGKNIMETPILKRSIGKRAVLYIL